MDSYNGRDEDNPSRTGFVRGNITFLHAPIHRAGFTGEGKRFPGSITKEITIEIEGLRFETLSKKVLSNDATFNLNPRERLVFSQVDTLSSQFLTALPDVLGIINDDAILEFFHQQLFAFSVKEWKVLYSFPQHVLPCQKHYVG